MGYSTTFKGEIIITPELTASQIKFIDSMFGDYREWGKDINPKEDFTWFDFEFNENLNGIRWNGGEKFYDADKKMKFLINRVVELYPNIIFNGIMQAQGEDFEDRWLLKVKNNLVTKEVIDLQGKRIECPHCGEKFVCEE